MTLFNKRIYLAFVFIVGMQVIPVYSNADYLKSFTHEASLVIANSKMAVLIVGLLFSSYSLFKFALHKRIECIRKSLDLKTLRTPQERMRAYNNFSEGYFDPSEFSINLKLSLMTLSYEEGVQENIGTMLRKISQSGGLQNLFFLDRIAYRRLVKENEDGFEANCRMRYKCGGAKEQSLSELETGVDTFSNLITNGLNVPSSKEDLCACNKFQQPVFEFEAATQIEQFFDSGFNASSLPQRPFLYHEKREGKDTNYHLYLENAKVYAQLTHYYPECITAIATIFENTQSKLAQNPNATICIH